MDLNCVHNGVFISYRRQENGQIAGRLYESLRQTFGGRVFYDKTTIPAGKAFPEYIRAYIQRCRIMLLLIGPQWFESFDTLQDDPDDFVRIEILAALERGVTIIPLLVDEARVPEHPDKYLPPCLRERELFRTQTGKLRSDSDYKQDLKRLNQRLKEEKVRPALWLRLRLPVAAVAGAGMVALAAATALGPPPTESGKDRHPAETSNFDNLSPDLAVRLRSATEETVYRIAATCDDKEIRQLAERYKDEPQLLLSQIKERLR